VEEHSLGFRTLADVEKLQQLVAQLRQHRRPLQRIAVVGAGASGVELACKLADSLEGAAVVELIERGSNLLPAAKSFNREQAKLALQRKDIRLRCHTEVVAVGSDHLELHGPQGTERLATNGVIWTAGLRFEAPPIEPKAPAGAKAATGANGRLACQPDLQVLGHPPLFAIGDIAQLDSLDPVPTTAQVAFQQADCLAANLLRSLANEPLEPFHFKDLGEMMSLGKGEAALTGGGFTFAGPAAFQIRRLAYLSRMPGKTHQAKVAAGWLGSAALQWSS
jgi:NADH dehydrogenase